MTTRECQKMALALRATRHKAFLPRKIGVEGPPKKCKKVPFFGSGKAPSEHIVNWRSIKSNPTFASVCASGCTRSKSPKSKNGGLTGESHGPS
jgi:hypothetical protein